MNEITITIYVFVAAVCLITLFMSFMQHKYVNIVSAIVCAMTAFMLSRISTNQTLVQTFGAMNASDVLVTETRIVESQPLSYLFLFVFIVAIILIVRNILDHVRDMLRPDIQFVDFD